MKYNLGICAIFRNEERYIREWMDYHLGIGIEFFYLFNNASTDRSRNIAMCHAHKCTIIPCPGKAVQLPAYNRALFELRNICKWVAFVDVDEFIVPKWDLSKKTLLQFLEEFEAYAGIGIHWKLFGSSGEKTYRPAPVIERFTRCAKEVNPHIKCIVKPPYVLQCYTPHTFVRAKDNLPLVDEHKKIIADRDPTPANGTQELIQINHYITKSMEECIVRRSKPRSDTGTLHHHDLDYWFKVHDTNDVQDLTALNIWKENKIK